jgi:predicted integral membrane protein DUF2269
MEWLFPWLLLLHVLGAIVAFGPTFAFPILGSMGGQEPQHANFATRATHAMMMRRVEPFALTMPVTGLAMMLVLGINPLDRAWWWLAVGIVLYVIAIGFAFVVQNRNVARIISLTSAPPPPGASGPPPEVARLVPVVQRGGMFLGLMIVAIVLLMVVKPTI